MIGKGEVQERKQYEIDLENLDKQGKMHDIITNISFVIEVSVRNFREKEHSGIKAGGIQPDITVWALIGHSHLTNRNRGNPDNHLSLFLTFVVRI